MTKQILFTPPAEKDLILAKNFYAKVEPTLGEYCVDSLMLDIERLRFFADIYSNRAPRDSDLGKWHVYRRKNRQLP